MLRCLSDRLKGPVSDLIRNLLVEEVAHRTGEDHSWIVPFQWQVQQILVNGDYLWRDRVSSVLHSVETGIQSVHVAVLASRRDFRTAGRPVPRCIGPFDARLIAQVYALLKSERRLASSAD